MVGLEERVEQRTEELTLINKKLLQEIEERKRAEDALRRSEEKYRSILESIEDAYFEVDLEGNLIFFDYAGDLSISADISNELSYLYPKKYVAVAYKKGGVTNISLRGKNIRDVLKKIIGRFKDATGGGHEDAVGARIRTEDLKEFKEVLKKEIS